MHFAPDVNAIVHGAIGGAKVPQQRWRVYEASGSVKRNFFWFRRSATAMIVISSSCLPVLRFVDPEPLRLRLRAVREGERASSAPFAAEGRTGMIRRK